MKCCDKTVKTPHCPLCGKATGISAKAPKGEVVTQWKCEFDENNKPVLTAEQWLVNPSKSRAKWLGLVYGPKRQKPWREPNSTHQVGVLLAECKSSASQVVEYALSIRRGSLEDAEERIVIDREKVKRLEQFAQMIAAQESEGLLKLTEPTQ